MNTIRIAITCFAVSILVSLVSRAWYSASFAYGEAAFYGGLLVGGVLWLVGAYYGYRAVRRR
ncbi:hypothetical protein [Haloplanus aerogenes]|uniref:Uncharacterized protein n=1 Tax=Haloplanus aerogenes TaxID=660522 RepID=A0A3M0CHN6_9EURY|nr:hypothetical protein [Haloplanus aerogenes]AZH26811.1 hypothetical protein DU502_16150 [Haloplanus aerogenes]RMB09098.1 hypothetical protein ATH50_3469 [Haloplanus aerogenes]